MTAQDKGNIKKIVDHFVEMYGLTLDPYYRAYEIWFEKKLVSEIVVDFLRKVNLPANVRIQKACKLPSLGINRKTYGMIHLVEENGRPILFCSPSFKSERFLIEIHEDCYKSFPLFITTLIHELSHLVLHSTHNRYRESEVATDLFVICFGLFDHVKSGGVDEYITEEQVVFAQQYVRLKRQLMKARGFEKILLKLQIHAL